MQTTTLKITGMTCGGCVNGVTKALQAVSGVTDASVSLQKAEATIQYDELTTNKDVLKSAVINAGYGAHENGQTPSIPTKGGCCG
ncbi:MAG: heavy-metal-associated domain-containing protein [Methylotenera sp.]|nr:heavy-metal-associated domain-containing protein [Methylotenera sp.]